MKAKSQHRKCRLGCRGIMVVVVGIFFTGIFATYLTFFDHGSAEDILEANSGPNRGQRHVVRRQRQDDDDDDDDIKLQLREEKETAEKHWETFIKLNNFVSIGEIYDSCEADDKVLVGKTIMIPDRRWGGVKSRTFINYTLGYELTGGQFFIEVKYNGRDLFDKHWELCTLDEDYDLKERFIFCPFEPRQYSWVKDRKIPRYLPKGRYETKGWITDQNNEVVLCGFSDFRL